MGLLSVSNLHKSFGTQTVLDGVTFEIQQNDRVGLIGVNGSGKTTLFKILTDELAPDGGQINKSAKTRVGYMEQHVCRDLQRDAYSEVLTVFASLTALELELEKISAQLRNNPQNVDALIEKQTALNDRYVTGGGLTFRSRAGSALIGLGFTEEQIKMPVGNLSGGQMAKLQLAKMLLGDSNLLLLDEPTNHLDISSVEWLEDFLRTYGGSYIVISHDRYFLDKITNITFELKNRRLKIYKGSYSSYLEQKEDQNEAVRRKYENTKKEIGRIEGIVEQQRRWNRERNIKTAESKLKAIGKLEQTLEKPESEDAAIHFHFKINQRGGNDVLSVKNLSLKFDGKTLFNNAAMEIHRGERIFLIGANGCGKSSFLKAILGINKPASGSFRIGTGIDIGYYDQLQSGLRPEKAVIDEVWDCYPQMTQTEVRNALAVFLFQNDDVFKPVSTLSGGERARILLLRLMLSHDNFLLLDEPTNHLDILSCEALENALQNYEGTLLIVSHDRYLINKLADRVYYLDKNGTRVYDGNYDDYMLENSKIKTCAKKTPSPNENGYKAQKERQAAIRKEKSEISRLETQIAQTEAKISKLKEELSDPDTASDYQAAMDIANKIKALESEDEALFAQWGVLAQKHEE